jgi:hypothetical protein
MKRTETERFLNPEGRFSSLELYNSTSEIFALAGNRTRTAWTARRDATNAPEGLAGDR